MSDDESGDETLESVQQDWDKILEPIMTFALGKKGIKCKDASEVGKKKVDYFRAKDFIAFLLKHEKHVVKKAAKALDAYLDGKNEELNEKDICKLGTALIKKGFIHEAQYKPLNEKKDEDGKVIKKEKKMA